MSCEKPILFSAPMVRAILDGTKTVTRRIIRPQPPEGYISRGLIACSTDAKREGKWLWESVPYRAGHEVRPPCLAGDLLWVRETWQAVEFTPDPETGGSFPLGIPKERGSWSTVYAADPQWPKAVVDRGWPWRPAIHMPRWASRTLLDVVSVRPERLWDIRDQDAVREGVTIPTGPECSCGDWDVEDPGPHLAHCPWRHPLLDPDHHEREVIEFACLWDSINGKRAPWESNPWVWRVEFRRAS